jgi:hypothetical protein
LCPGDGWFVQHVLFTKSRMGSKREPVTAEQAAVLWKSIDPAKQVIYEGVTKCTCQGGGHES